LFRLLFVLVLIAIFIYVTTRFYLKISSGRPGRSIPPTDPGDALVQDPNCLTYLSKKAALEVRSGGATHYFCSPTCAEAFEKKRAEKKSP